MTSTKSAETRRQDIDFPIVWQLLTQPEQAEFWRYAGQHARALNHNSTVYTHLCAALRNAESSRNGGRTIKAFPGAARRRSADELRIGVAKTKGLLLEQPDAELFLVGAFCNWIQAQRRDALKDVLDAVQCPHDERGTLKGEVPAFTPENASRDICALVSAHSSHDLQLVCGALMLNKDIWGGLWTAYQALARLPEKDAINHRDEQSTRLHTPESSAPVRVKPIEGQLVNACQAMREELQRLGQLLGVATVEISEARVPDLQAVIDGWASVRHHHEELERGLGISSRSLDEFEFVLQQRSTAALAISQIARCQLIEHVTDREFGGCATIRAKCEQFVPIVAAEPGVDPSILQSFTALLQLVEFGNELDDEQATQLQSDVESLFGKSVATAALRGKLSFGRSPSSSPDVRASEAPAAAPNFADAGLKVYDGATADVAAESVSPGLSGLRMVASSMSPAVLAEPAVAQVLVPEFAEAASSTPGTPAGPAAVETQIPAEITPRIAQMSEVADVDIASVDVGERAGRTMTVEPPDPIQDYQSFDNFCRNHWVNESGAVATAPWQAQSFVESLTAQVWLAWERGAAALAYLFSRAIDAVGGVGPLDTDDLASADKLLSDPVSLGAGFDARRVERLRACMVDQSGCDTPNIGFTLVLEALRPTLPCSFLPVEIDALIDRASFNDPALDEVLRFLLQGWSAQLDPLSLLRARLLDPPEESLEVVEAAVRDAQRLLRTQIATLWSAGGGKILKKHCRYAWTKFIQAEIVSLREDLAPEDVTESWRIVWTPERIRQRVIAVGRSFKRIMDTEEVWHRDRSAAEGAAAQIVEAVDVVADALQRLDAQRQRSRLQQGGIPIEAGQRLLAGSSSNTTDRLSAALFAAVLHAKPQPNVLRLHSGHLVAHPDVIRYLEPEVLSRTGIASDGVGILDFESPAAVSVLLAGWDLKEPVAIDEDSSLWISLRDVAADRERRDILATLSSTEVLQPHERTLLHRYALELGDQAFEAARELERLWGASNELMVSTESRLKTVVEEAKSLTSVTSTKMTHSLLLLAWLKQMVSLASAQRDVAAQALLELAGQKPADIATQVTKYFEQGDYRAGVALFHGGAVPKQNGDRLGIRRTLWREDALKTWPEPKTKLVNDFMGSTTEQTRLVELWTVGTIELNHRDRMPRLLYAVISGEAGRSSSENQKRFPVKLADLREHKERKTSIRCDAIRDYFRKSRLNPSFLPQLADFGEIVLVPAPMQASRVASVLDDWCKAAGNEAPTSLVVFLAPGLSLARRDELCSGLRKRGVMAAIVDDLDLCRLCAASVRLDGHDFIPFLEVVLEQLDLDRASPFSSLDGQHVRPETYVGRKYEAERVALGWSYTRVFSGRKLGKSALLKYVANTFDGYPLPSGNTLNVFFITIAGGESERWIVDGILHEMSKRFGLTEDGLTDRPPTERFSEYMKRFIQERPRHSVLLILDEADAFVEGQLARYDQDREGSLSFRMMKDLPTQVDGNQLPRIRTILSGYRVTNTRGGVWANAGDVLVLRPLAEEEAVLFLQGMLARIGIALGDHAPFVAMRCGFQPAVLIRFGESLVRRLKRSNRSADRETLTVSHDEVLATLGEQGVLDEIKTVVNNNFQGNRIGAVVFGATLLALKDLEPGLALTEGPSKVLAKLREIDPNSDWLERVDTSPLAEIERNLQDFIDRELLTASDAPRFGGREYRLRFPHFLPVLTQQSEVALEVRQQIQAIRSGATQRRMSQCVLSESALDIIRYWYGQDSSADCRLIVVGGHWCEALLDPKSGLPDRLGCERSAVSLDCEPVEVGNQVGAGIQVFSNANIYLWERLLTTDTERPLVLIGGLGLQRAARQYALDGGQVPVEVVTLGRLTQSTLTWWLEDARALHFKAGNSIARISQATGLVPYLVGKFDSLLRHAPGSDVSESELEVTLAAFEAHLSEYASQLGNTAYAGSLTQREIELLKMAAQVAEEVSEEFDLEKEFQDYWLLIEKSSTANAPFSDAGDWSALKLLAEAGLLPVRANTEVAVNAQSLGKVNFGQSAALVRLIKSLGDDGAA
jgi:hypothetical protein